MADQSNNERVMLYRRGFHHGTAHLAKQHNSEPNYERGYADGLRALSTNLAKFCREIGHDPSMDILR